MKTQKRKKRKKKKRRKLPNNVVADIQEASSRKIVSKEFNIDRQTLIHVYWNVGMSQQQIGILFGVTRQSVGNKMREYGISTRKGRPQTTKKRTRKLKVKKVNTCPNTYEQKIIDVCEHMHYPFTFVGDKFNVIEDKSPDFIDSNGSHKIIEVYSKHWHKADYEATRGKFFEDRGYATLFLSDDDLNDENWQEVCSDKINDFLKKDTN